MAMLTLKIRRRRLVVKMRAMAVPKRHQEVVALTVVQKKIKASGVISEATFIAPLV